MIKVIEEKNTSSINKYLLSGIFTEFDPVNRNNGRIYTEDSFLEHLRLLNFKIRGSKIKRILSII
jgi:hypothetical protein